LRTAKSVRLFGFYRRLVTEGYAKVKRTMGTTGKSSFYNAVNDLKNAGFSKAQLQNLDKKETLPLVHLFKFDFDAQRPANYIEPKMPCADLDYSQFLAVISSGSAVREDALSIDRRVAIALEQFGLPDAFVEGLKAGRSVRLTGERSLSLAIWEDGEFDLFEHVGSQEINDIRRKLALRRAFTPDSSPSQLR